MILNDILFAKFEKALLSWVGNIGPFATQSEFNFMDLKPNKKEFLLVFFNFIYRIEFGLSTN